MDYRVIILADRSGAELSPLDRVACPALLEVGGRCVIEYTLEDLSEVGAQEVVIVSAHVDSLRERLGDGGRWGIRISYLLTRPEQSPNDCVRRITGRGPVLLVRGDIVRGRCVGAFLRLAEIKTYRTVAAVSHRMDAGICLINGVWTHGCTWPSFELGVGVVEIGGVGLFRLESLRNLHAACLAASRGEIPGVEPAGRDMGDGQVRCRLSQSDGVDLRDGRLFVGESAKISRGVKVEGTVMIGSGAFVDEGASLENTVVMPGTYIGREVELKNAIIAGRHLIRIDINATTEVPDDFLLSPVHHSKSSAGRVSLVNRAAGIALLALSAPLWPIAIVISHMGQSPQHRIPRTFLSNVRPDGSRREFTVRELETSVPALRNLPWLIPVARGDLRLFGVRPSEPGAVSRHEDDAPAGIIGPALLDVGPDASDEEIALGERVFAGTRNNTNRPRYLLRSLAALFSARAWLPAR
jgi:NDP-sugar pyrophosphorylase family protein